jgi:hypothetical protein
LNGPRRATGGARKSNLFPPKAKTAPSKTNGWPGCFRRRLIRLRKNFSAKLLHVLIE